jgi:hypothetical protein
MNPRDGEQLHCSKRWAGLVLLEALRASPYMLDAATGGEHWGRRRVESELLRQPRAAPNPNRGRGSTAGGGWVGTEPNFVTWTLTC